ncbi:MAG: diguanylate cyclase [Desulfocapsaceae bacterium]|nr:diguanylate cyclase [Desulfocapsaceae bacterium]
MEQKTHSTTILIVDDEELVRMSLSALIANLHFHCVAAADGLEAAEILKRIKCDLVLTDILMPNMGGLELLEYIKENHNDTDVIIATGHSDQASYADVIKAGAIDFIKKPIEGPELEAKLTRALRERQLIRELEQMSMCDGLTSLLNRRAFDFKFQREVERAYRQSYDLFLAVLDVDNFKEYNDTHGHQSGDKVLIELAKILDVCTRNSVDMNFRLGGDEFAILLPQANATQATEVVQRVLLSFVEQKFSGLTLSIGIVSCRHNTAMSLEQDVKNMEKRADTAMYEAKNSGKNCVVCRIKR